MSYLSDRAHKMFVTALVMFAHPVAQAQPQGEAPVPAVTVQIQLQPPPGVPAGGIPITVIPVGTIEYASVRSVSNDSGLVSFRVPLAWFPPDANPPSLGAHIMVNDFGTRGGRQVAETIVARSEIGIITGPFRADTPVSATIALAPSASASGNVTVAGRQRFDVSCDDQDIISLWLNYPKLINGKWNIAGLPRVPKLTLMFASDSCERIVTLDLSAGNTDWGTVVLPQPQGSSRLRLKILGVPESVPASSALLLSLSTGVSYIASNRQRDGILLGRPEDAAGIALPPGQYAVLVGGLHLDETLAFYKKYSRDQQPIDPTKVPIITLVDGQTSEIELSWAEWRSKLLEYSPALTIRSLAAMLDAVPGGGAPQTSGPRLYIPPGMRPNIPTLPPPQSPTTPPPSNPNPAQNSNP
jgi:hypothetical protein